MTSRSPRHHLQAWINSLQLWGFQYFLRRLQIFNPGISLPAIRFGLGGLGGYFVVVLVVLVVYLIEYDRISPMRWLANGCPLSICNSVSDLHARSWWKHLVNKRPQASTHPTLTAFRVC